MIKPFVKPFVSEGFVSPFVSGLSIYYALPSYFQSRWNPSFNITGSGLGGYATNYNPNSDKPTGVVKFVDVATGNDTTGDGTQILPYKTLQKAYDEGADIISAAGGWYDKANGFNTNFNPARDLAIQSTDSNTVFINRAENGLSWTEQVAGTHYSVTVSDPSNVVDMTNGRTGLYLINGTTLVPLRLTEVASTALVESTAGSWFHDGTDLHVHTFDSRTPDSDVKVLSSQDVTNSNNDITLWIQDCEIWGHRPMRITPSVLLNTAKLICNRVAARYADDTNCWLLTGLSNTRLISCHASDSKDNDGFGYIRTVSGGLSGTYHLEVDCISKYNGTNTNDNGSTTHSEVTIIRLNGDYGENTGPNVADSTGSWALNLGSTADNGLYGFQAGSLSNGNPAVQYNQDCSANGNSSRDWDKSAGGLQFSLGGNVIGSGKINTSNYIELDVYPELETILLEAPDSIESLFCTLDTALYNQMSSSDIQRFYDVGFNKFVIDRASDTYLAARNSTLINGVPGFSVDYTPGQDTKYTLQTGTMNMFGLSFIGQYGDGTNATFAEFDSLFVGTGTNGQYRIMGDSGLDTIRVSQAFTTQISRDGAAKTSTVLPMPMDFYDFEESTQTVRADVYTLLGNNVTTGNPWGTDAMGLIIMRNRAWTTAEELAIRTAAKALFGVS